MDRFFRPAIAGLYSGAGHYQDRRPSSILDSPHGLWGSFRKDPGRISHTLPGSTQENPPADAKISELLFLHDAFATCARDNFDMQTSLVHATWGLHEITGLSWLADECGECNVEHNAVFSEAPRSVRQYGQTHSLARMAFSIRGRRPNAQCHTRIECERSNLTQYQTTSVSGTARLVGAERSVLSIPSIKYISTFRQRFPPLCQWKANHPECHTLHSRQKCQKSCASTDKIYSTHATVNRCVA